LKLGAAAVKATGCKRTQHSAKAIPTLVNILNNLFSAVAAQQSEAEGIPYACSSITHMLAVHSCALQ
jgi:hypothetical protein